MKCSTRRVCASVLLFVWWMLLLPQPAGAYSVLSHEEVVDIAWIPQIVPLLRSRFPGITEDELRDAHAYAYGGSVIQDIGYYPFGSHYFSDLLHYARTGDFVATLIRESASANEYAFSLGALAHYCGDVWGHPAVNEVTADEYPKLRSRFGRIVTYAQDPTAHVRTEFGFDVVQVAQGHYSQQNYRDFIGFKVAKPLLERAFQETYGIPMNAVITHEDLAIGSYRRAVSGLIPRMTTVALVNYRKQMVQANPTFDQKKFVYRLKRTEYEKEYGTQYVHPGVGSRMLAFFFAHLPKIGPLKVFELKVPDPAEQNVYIRSINLTVDHYKRYMEAVLARPVIATPVDATPTSAEVSAGPVKTPELKEIDLDTGKPAQFGEYVLADKTYAKLLHEILTDPKTHMQPDVYDSFKDFFTERKEPAWYEKKAKDWAILEADLVRLDTMPKPVAAPVVGPVAPAAKGVGGTK